jgi:hypothetical protein
MRLRNTALELLVPAVEEDRVYLDLNGAGGNIEERDNIRFPEIHGFSCDG